MDVDAAAVVTRAFGLGTVVSPPVFVARGAMGALWRVETERGSWAVKRLFHDAGDGVPGDLRLQTAAADAGVRRPEPIRAPGGAFVLDRTRVYEWVDLGPAVRSPASGAHAGEAGAVLGRLHALALTPAGAGTVDEWYVSAPASARWRRLLDRAVTAGAAWTGALEARLPLLLDLSDFVSGAGSDRAADVVECHRDLTPSNVFHPTPGDPDQRFVVVDWENAGPLSAEAELAMSMSSFADPDGAASFLEGYRRAGGTASIRGRASFAVELACVVNFVAVMGDQALDGGAGAEHVAFAEARLGELLAVGSGVEALGARIDAFAAQGWTP